ncbi:2-dehydro-3-deoxygalactonokinase [Chitinimonas sp.]|uniref:2-dehydro-3-deoxygalactonokinase n=1 Tax=Chitinimonas sp. TaxID=1934313 RepID=UPI002F952803
MSGTAVAVDWGSTHRRAYVFGADGTLLHRHADAEGVLKIGRDFAASLNRLLDGLPGPRAGRVVMSGMIGSRSGWVEAPYLPTPVDVAGLGQALQAVPFDGVEVAIVPGICDDTGPDVMRGEETQLLGAWLQEPVDGVYLLPGTHSKWVAVRHGRLTGLHTFMTGELFAGLRQQGTLAGVLGERADVWSAFDAGLAAAGTGAASRLLFGVRAAVLRQRLGPDEALSYLSGLLIGMEWTDPLTSALRSEGELRLVGDTTLAALYRRAGEYWQTPVRCMDPDAAYITAARRLLGGSQR